MVQDSLSPKNSKPAAHKKRGFKKPKKITQTYLHNAGLYYLQRFSSSSGNFRSVMLQKVKRSCAAHPEQSYETCALWVDELVQKFIGLALLNDAQYAANTVYSLRRRGKSQKAIAAYLRTKNLSTDEISTALQSYDDEFDQSGEKTEYEAALHFIRKRRIGPFRGTKPSDPQKDLAKLARAGFSYETARNILSVQDDDFEIEID